MGFKLNGDFGTYKNFSLSENRVNSSENVLISDALTNNRNRSKWNSMSYNLNFLHQFNESGHELSGDIDYTDSKYRNTIFLDTQFSETENQKAYHSARKGYTPSNTNLVVAKADYALPINETLKFETGWKSSFLESDNNARYDTISSGNWINDSGTTNRFIYKEKIHAGYINYNQNFKFMSVQAGLRAEYTETTGNQITTNTKTKRNYINWFPSVFLKKNIGEKHNLQLSYSRRIDRPDYYDLNPFRFFRDPTIFYEGNPFLQPELTHSFNWSYSFDSKYLISFFYSTTQMMLSLIP